MNSGEMDINAIRAAYGKYQPVLRPQLDTADKTFWALTCACGGTFGAWDKDPNEIDVQVALACPYCGGKREKLLA